MREINFRIWTGDVMIYSEIDSVSDVARLHPEYIMQSTGLVDKKGNPVYEGDILMDSDDNLSKIVWSETAAMFGRLYLNGLFIYGLKSYQMSEDHEIIGNIYENKELLDG